MTLPFKIRCGSCKVVLNIKDSKLVGKRVACPKCKKPLVINAPVPAGKKKKKPASSQSIILEDQEDEYSDDGFANALSGTIKTPPSISDKTAKKSKVIKRKSHSSGSMDSFDDEDFEEDDFEDDDFDDDDEFLSDDEVPVSKKRKGSRGKSSSDNLKKYLPGLIVLGVLVLGGVAYGIFGGGSSSDVTSVKSDKGNNDKQEVAEAPSAPKSQDKADKPKKNNSGSKVTMADVEDSGKKTKSKSKRKTTRKIKSTVVSKTSSKLNLAHLYEDSEAVIRIDMKGILASSFVKKIMDSSGGLPIPEEINDMESIMIGVKGLSAVPAMAQKGALSPATIMMNQSDLSAVKYITVVRFNTNVDQEEILKKGNAGNSPNGKNSFGKIKTNEIEFEDYVIHVTSVTMPGSDGKKNEVKSAVCFYDDRTMISGQLEDVQYAIENAEVNIPRSSEFMKSKYASQQFVAILAPADPEKFFSESAKSAEEDSNGEISSFLSPELIKDFVSVSLGISFSDSLDIKTDIQSGEAETTETVEEKMKEGIELASSLLQAQAGSMPEQFKDMISLGEELLERVEISLDENALAVSLSLQESDLEVLKKLPAIMMAMAMQQSMGGQGPGVQTINEQGSNGSSGKPVQVGQSRKSLKEIGLAFHNYADVYNGSLPTAYLKTSKKKPGLSWRVELLPFLGEKDLYEEFDLKKPWDDPHNLELADKIPDVFKPIVDLPEKNLTQYRIVSDETTVISPKKQNKMTDVFDGLSNTVIVLEVGPDLATVWTKPDPIENDDEVLDSLIDGTPGFNALYADGRVDLIFPSNVEDLRMLLTRDGGEDLSKEYKGPKVVAQINKGDETVPGKKSVREIPKVKKKKTKKIAFNSGDSKDEKEKSSKLKKSKSVKGNTSKKKKTSNKSSKSGAIDIAANIREKRRKSKNFKFSFGKNREEKRKFSSKKKDTSKKKNSFLDGGDDSEDLDVDVQELVDAGAEVKKDEDSGDVTWLKMSGSEVDDEMLEKICQISTIQHLIISKTSITDDGLVHLSELSELKKLILTETKITDEGVDSLISLDSLTNLSIKKTEITKTGAKKIRNELKDCKVIH